MFGWLRKRRRQRLWSQTIPSTWDDILYHNAVFTQNLGPGDYRRVCRIVQVLMAEKHWEGCSGLHMTDEHKLTIAAQMARMSLGFDEEYFPETKSILLYPAAYVASTQTTIGSGFVIESEAGRSGEAWYRGPVILTWDDVLATGRGENFARNVVIHEFAHQLDMRNGKIADGVPGIESARLADQWQTMLAEDYQQLRHDCRHAIRSILDCYGATSQAEFFAVASEAYFEEPRELFREWPRVYTLLDRFYRPAAER
jgi:Mlc titration factor MtfA (ptsG expression regulator)